MQHLRVESDESREAIFYRQWSSSAGTKNIMGEITMANIDPYITGMPEMEYFFNYKFLRSEAVRRQYTNIDFFGVPSLEKKFKRLFSDDDMTVSLFNATNMRYLFEYGKRVDINPTTGYYNVQEMEYLARDMQGFNEEELFAIYAYLVNLIEFTFIRSSTQSNTFDKISMALVLTDVLRNEFIDFRAVFTSKLLGAVAHKFLSLDTCEEGSVRLFPNTATRATCKVDELKVNTLEGIEFWIRLYIGRHPNDEQKLKSLTGYTLADFDQYFLDDNSVFTKFTRSLFDGIGVGKLDKICRKNANVW